MKLNNIITSEKIISELQQDPTKDIFPVTLIKYLLNIKKISNFFDRTNKYDIYDLPSYIEYDSNKCDACIHNERKMLCRKHTSIERVINTDRVCFDVDTKIFIYMNEIFQISDDGKKLSIVYAPHTKLIQGPLTEYKAKKISMISTYLPFHKNGTSKINLQIPKQTQFSSSDLMKMYIKVWFNDEFSLITIPGDDELHFCLVPNK